jgi:hypothetical protein
MGMAKLQHQNKVRNCMFEKVIKNVVLGEKNLRKKGNLFYVSLAAILRLLN